MPGQYETKTTFCWGIRGKMKELPHSRAVSKYWTLKMSFFYPERTIILIQMLKERLIYLSKFVSLMENAWEHMSFLWYPQLLIYRCTHLHSLSLSLWGYKIHYLFLPILLSVRDLFQNLHSTFQGAGKWLNPQRTVHVGAREHLWILCTVKHCFAGDIFCHKIYSLPWMLQRVL